jgi:hypothetical protein
LRACGQFVEVALVNVVEQSDVAARKEIPRDDGIVESG